MSKRIVSFGDSFVWGSELKQNTDGSRAWPGLVAQSLGWQYHTCAVPGCGNEAIARQVFDYFHTESRDSVLAVINWTWPIRYDFYSVVSESWTTIGPTCVPPKLERVFGNHEEAQRILDLYNDYLGHSTIWDRTRSLQPMYAVQQYLKSSNIPCIQTHMDLELFDCRWHAPGYIQELQQLVLPELQLFEGKNFLDWSRDRDFAVTEPGWHPLEAAHRAAADLWRNIYAQALV
jgi:hypothetical protein